MVFRVGRGLVQRDAEEWQEHRDIARKDRTFLLGGGGRLLGPLCSWGGDDLS